MNVTKSDISTIANLANLDIPESEQESYVLELTNILELIGQMEKFDTAGCDPMSHPQEIELALRPDEVTEPDQRTDLQPLAPLTERGLYLVPKVLD